MAINVTYSVVPRINPREKNDSSKYYAQTQASGDVNIRGISKRIQQTCTVTKTDVYAVLFCMGDVIIDTLKSGEIVRLGNLGTLKIGVSGKGTPTEEEYNSSLIRKARINFRPGVALSGMLTTLTYIKVPKKAVPVKVEEDGTTI